MNTSSPRLLILKTGLWIVSKTFIIEREDGRKRGQKKEREEGLSFFADLSICQLWLPGMQCSDGGVLSQGELGLANRVRQPQRMGIG